MLWKIGVFFTNKHQSHVTQLLKKKRNNSQQIKYIFYIWLNSLSLDSFNLAIHLFEKMNVLKSKTNDFQGSMSSRLKSSRQSIAEHANK